MTRSIRVELVRLCDCNELVDFLETRGLAGELAETDDHWQIEIGCSEAEETRTRDELWAALRTWLAEQQPDLVPAVLDDETYVLRPPGE